MLGFREPVLYHANGKVYGRVNSSSGTEVVEPVNGERVRRDGFLVVCVVSTLSLLLATSSVVLNVVVTRERFVAQMGQQRELQDVCLPCHVVTGSNPMESDLESLERLFQSRKKKWNEGSGRRVEELDTYDEEEEGDEMCCANDANQLEALLNKILDERKSELEWNDVSQRSGDGPFYLPACDLSSLGSSNGTACLLPSSSSLSLNPNAAVAAHLVASPSSSASATNSDTRGGSDDGLKIIKWNPTTRRSFHRGLNVNSTHLLPSLPGFYFVYSQVSFQFRSSTTNDDDSFKHVIKRFNTRNPNGGVELLMQHSSTIRGGGSQSSPSSSSHSVTDSSFLGGLVRVYHNDKLYVEASHHRSLRSLSTATFFGMFKL